MVPTLQPDKYLISLGLNTEDLSPPYLQPGSIVRLVRPDGVAIESEGARVQELFEINHHFPLNPTFYYMVYSQYS